MKRLFAIAVAPLFVLAGCATGPEFGEVSSAIQDSQQMQSETDTSTPEPRKTSELDPEALARLQAIEDDKDEWEDEQQAEELGNESLQLAVNAVDENLGLLDESFTEVGDRVVAGPSVPGKLAEETAGILATGISMWDESYGVIENYQLVMFKAEDAAWADEIRTGFGDRVYFGSFQAGVKDYGDFCSFALAIKTRIYMCVPDNEDISYFKAVVPHEYYHLIQQQMGISTQLPVWLFEGFATFYGDLATGVSGKTLTEGKGNLRQGAMATYFGQPSLYQYVDSIPEDKFYEIFRALEMKPVGNVPEVLDKYSGYLWSFLAAQYLVGVHGHSRVMEYQELVGAGNEWRGQFETSFGLTLNEFYPLLLVHIQEAFSR